MRQYRVVIYTAKHQWTSSELPDNEQTRTLVDTCKRYPYTTYIILPIERRLPSGGNVKVEAVVSCANIVGIEIWHLGTEEEEEETDNMSISDEPDFRNFREKR